MKTGGKLGICSLVGVLLSAGAFAASPAATADAIAAGNQYDEIVERNVFNLHAPPPPPNPEDLVKKTPPPETDPHRHHDHSRQRNWFFSRCPPPKPGAAPDSIMLAEGRGQQNDVEVRNIDEKAGVVKVSNHGQDQTLDFDHDGAKPGPPPAGAPPATTLPPPSAPPPNVMSLPQPGNVVRPIRTLQPRGNPFSNNGNNGGLGGGTMGTMGGNGQGGLSREEQVALMEVQRMQFQREGKPSTLLPPTVMTPGPDGEPMGEAPPAPQ